MNTRRMEPLSWLLLERYALGEVSADERAAVEARLQASYADRARLESILHEQVELAPLPVSVSVPARTRQAKPPHEASRFPLAALTLAAAAAVLVLVRWPAASPDTSPDSALTLANSRNQTKGSAFSLSLVSQQGTLDPQSFAQGESFKVLVTCPPAFEEPLRLFIFQGGERYEPLAPVQLVCGNQVPWPGAFSLDGSEPAIICVSANPDHANAFSAVELGAEGTCATLSPR